MKDIADLLEEVHTIVQALRGEKMMLEDRLKTLEDELSTVKEAKKTMTRDLQEMKEKLGRELQETKEKLGRELQVAKQKLDQVHPEMQSLQNELENAEVQNNLLAMDIQRKDEEIKKLALRLREYTSLIPASLQIEEPIG